MELRVKSVVGCAMAAALLAGAVALILSDTAAAQQDISKAVAYRQAVMKTNTTAFGGIFMVLKGEAGAPANIIHHARVLRHNALLVPTLFPAGAEGGNMKPEMWQEIDKVLAAAKALGPATEALVAAAETGDMSKIGPAAGAVGKACGGCHETYKISYTPKR